MKVNKAIIPVAGWGTRMLPVTKAVEKCMMPVGTRPVVDYVVEDVIKAGISNIYFVVAEHSTQLQAYYSENTALNDYLKRVGKEDKLGLVSPPEGVSFHYITQPSVGSYGTSVPVGLASEFIGEDESALVIMGDQFFYRPDGGSNAADLIQEVQTSGNTAGLFGVEVSLDDIEKYGVIEKDSENNFVKIVEKPSSADAPSNLNNASFYLFNKEIFELARTLPINPARGEHEVTDAINTYVASGKNIHVSTLKGEYMECGSVEGWLRANNRIASRQ